MNADSFFKLINTFYYDICYAIQEVKRSKRRKPAVYIQNKVISIVHGMWIHLAQTRIKKEIAKKKNQILRFIEK